MKKIIDFLDKHRLILIILILLIISILFLGINSIIFFNHNFKNLKCTSKLDETFCYNNEVQIYINPEKEKERIFKEKETEIESLKKTYKLPSFNYYTSYFYEVASLLEYNSTNENEDLLIFFKNYNSSYKISDFYKKNTIYYDIFYHYKII